MKARFPRKAVVDHAFELERSRAKSAFKTVTKGTQPSSVRFDRTYRPLFKTSTRLERILVAIDFSEESNKALQYAGAFARQAGAVMIALHVVRPIACHADYGYGPVTRQVPDLRLLRRARRKLNLFGRTVLRCGLKLATTVRSGLPHQEIIKAARELNADLIVIGTRGEFACDARSLASTAERVVRHAPCPVLVVRKSEHEFVCCRK